MNDNFGIEWQQMYFATIFQIERKYVSTLTSYRTHLPVFASRITLVINLKIVILQRTICDLLKKEKNIFKNSIL